MPLSIALDYRPALLSRAGIGRATRELARALASDEQLDVHLFGHSLARAKVKTDVPPGAHLHRLPIAGRLMPQLQRLGLGADRLAGRSRVFHWTDYVQPSVNRAQVVLTVHDLAFVRDPRWHGNQADELRQRTSAAVERADHVIVPSTTTADDLRAFVGIEKPTRVIPFGADHVPTTPFANPMPDRDYALCVGTIEPRKNHRKLLAAWRLLSQPKPVLVVVGDVGWECADIVRDLDDAVREGIAVWRRHVTDEDMWPLLQHAKLLAYPSLWEGFGFPPLEAMAMGVPVVAHQSDPMRERGQDAIALTDANDPAALAEAIERILRDDNHRTRLVADGKRRAKSFTWQQCAQAHAEVYREVSA